MDPTPLQDALRRYGFTKRAWSKLLEADLVEPATRIAGSKRYELSARNVRRLSDIAVARRNVKKRKLTSAAIAFELARSGDHSVPTGLVKDFLCYKIEHGQGFIKRTFQRHLGLSPNLAQVKETDLYRIANKLAKGLTKRSGHKKAHEFLRLCLSMVLRMMYLGRDVRGDSFGLRELLAPYVSLNHADHGRLGMPYNELKQNAEQIVTMISGIKDSISLDPKRNSMLRQIPKIPDDVFWRLFGVWPEICEAVHSAYHEIASAVSLPSVSKAEWVEFDIFVLTGIMTYYDQNHPSELYQELLRGSAETFCDTVENLVQTVRMAAKVQKFLADAKGLVCDGP
jgi:hypothetical protein